MREDTNKSSFPLVFLEKFERLPLDTGSQSSPNGQKEWEPKVVRSPVLRMPAVSNPH